MAWTGMVCPVPVVSVAWTCPIFSSETLLPPCKDCEGFWNHEGLAVAATAAATAAVATSLAPSPPGLQGMPS